MFSGISDPGFRTYAIGRGENDCWIKGAMDLTRLNEMIAENGGPESPPVPGSADL